MKIGVIGSGTMGSGIAQTLAKKHEVLLSDISSEIVEKSILKIEKGLSKLVSKERMTEEDKDSILKNIKVASSLKDMDCCDVVVEASTENLDVKKKIFKELSEVCTGNTIFATNTSSLSITEIATSTDRPEQVIGMHFFNPVPVMKLVEVINGKKTSKDVTDKIMELAKEVGKTPVLVEEGPGFVVNRILIPMINEAIGILADGFASKEDIDAAMKLGANHPMGPLALGDLIGLDVCLAIMEVLYREFADPKYRPHPLLRKMVRAGQLGMKTKEGFYNYNK